MRTVAFLRVFCDADRARRGRSTGDGFGYAAARRAGRGVRERLDARLETCARAPPPPPQEADDIMLCILIYLFLRTKFSLKKTGAPTTATTRDIVFMTTFEPFVSKRIRTGYDGAPTSSSPTSSQPAAATSSTSGGGRAEHDGTESCSWSTHREGARPPRSRHPARRDAAAASGGVMPRAAACAQPATSRRRRPPTRPLARHARPQPPPAQ